AAGLSCPRRAIQKAAIAITAMALRINSPRPGLFSAGGSGTASMRERGSAGPDGPVGAGAGAAVPWTGGGGVALEAGGGAGGTAAGAACGAGGGATASTGRGAGCSGGDGATASNGMPRASQNAARFWRLVSTNGWPDGKAAVTISYARR